MGFEYWFMFPTAILIATIAMASGVEGATFFTPLFILGLGLPTEVAVGTGLITETFGFSSGLYAYVRRGLIDYELGQRLLLVTVPLALLGTWVAQGIPSDVLKGILGVGLLAIAVSFLGAAASSPPGQQAVSQAVPQGADSPTQPTPIPQTCITAATGETLCYTVTNPTEGRVLSGLGALFLGMVSTGLGEMNGYFLIQRCRVPSKVAVATSVFVVAITALTASLGHGVQFVRTGGETLSTVLSLVKFTVPGVLIGAQVGSMVASRLSPQFLERAMGLLFVAVGALVLGEVLLSHRSALAALL